ncbi:YhjD/YihY/BrkB family envelope integrity protein [Nannocystis sp.]|uniref:YihY/virulence factor BrkB family protein n=1 Tax=Nannocystis sp. TaxID=1962667 RepID=UPI0025EA1351|nr:YhjD/YihY/BrkB family envelope integrity protein [Nannocystis sp.]MBK7825937.1 YihY family inner membrane protein [Nannocystis sp.]
MSDPDPPRPPALAHPPRHSAVRDRLRRLPRFLVPRVAQVEVSRAREAWLVLVYAARRWIQVDRSATLASSLALQTVLSIVPFAGLVLTLLGLLGKDQARDFLNRIAGMLIPEPERAGTITEGIYELARNVTLQNLGIVGFLGSLAGASLLFLTIESTVNDIWRVKFRRSAVAKFTMFYTLATLAPLVIFFSLGRPFVATITEQHGFSLLPILSTSLAFILLNRLMPATRVRWHAALIGGFAGAALFELGKRGFALFLANITSYEGTYGALAALPVFCVWAYVSWLIVLFSVELACVVQLLPLVRREGYVPPNLREDADEGVGAARLACRLVLAICDYYDRVGAGLSARTLGARFQVDAPRLSSVVNRLEQVGILLHVEAPEAAYLPGRPLDQLTVLEIMRLFASRDVDVSRHDHLTALFTRLDSSVREIFGAITFMDLIHEERRRRADRPIADNHDEHHEHAPAPV